MSPVLRFGSGRSESLRQKIASRVEAARRSSAFPAGRRPDGRRSAALREPIDHRLDSASFMSGARRCAVWRVAAQRSAEARWCSGSAFSGHSLAVRTARMTNEHRRRPSTCSQTRLSSTPDNNDRYLSAVVRRRPDIGAFDLCRSVRCTRSGVGDACGRPEAWLTDPTPRQRR